MQFSAREWLLTRKVIDTRLAANGFFGGFETEPETELASINASLIIAAEFLFASAVKVEERR